MNSNSKSTFTQLVNLVISMMMGMMLSSNIYAACTGTTTTWQGTSTTWNATGNWDTGSIPDTAGEDVVIVGATSNLNFDTNATIGCLNMISGTATNNNGVTITITGDEFTAAADTMTTTGSNFRFTMAGSSNQTVNVVDGIRDFYVTNTNTVTLQNTFRIRRETSFPSSGTLNVEGGITFNRKAYNYTIPSGYTVVIKSGGELYVKGNFTINGTVKVEGGGTLKMHRDKTLTVASGGVLELAGSSGNPAIVKSEATNRIFIFDMSGTLIADYFSVDGANTAGMNVSGTISQLDNGNFRRVADLGHLITLQASASVPATWDTVGFYNDNSVATPKNIDATLYTGSAFTIDNFAGDIADSTYETDPSNKISWSAAAATELSITNEAETGEPGNFYDPGDEFNFAEFAFTLTQADTETDITSVDITMTGTGSIGDLDWVRVYVDSNNNCNVNTGADTLLAEPTFSGNPPKATVTFTTGQVATDGPSNQACFGIRAKAAAGATDGKTIKFAVQATGDVSNSEGYSFSTTAAPPIEGKATTIRNPNYATWEGSISQAWSLATNWAGTAPSSTQTCYVGSGSSVPQVDVNPIECLTAILQTAGEIDWNLTTNDFNVYGNLEIQSSFVFTNAGSSVINMVAAANQTITASESIPNDLVINNTGTTSNNVVTLSSDLTVNGDLICREGVLNVPDTRTLTVLGDITVEDGCELDIDGGGTLEFNDDKVMTVNSGGTFTIVGTASKDAIITATTAGYAYNIDINGTIAARYYSFTQLQGTGLDIAATASIDGTNYLQDGSFSEPIHSNTTFLTLHRQIPGDELTDMFFDASGGLVGLVNLYSIDTTDAASGTLTLNGVSGDLANPTYDIDPLYNISWEGATTNLEVTVEDGPDTAEMTTGNTYYMGRIGFKIKDAGASFSDTDITSLTLELDGDGTAGDISSVRLLADDDCDGASGTLLGTGTFTGSPSAVTFSLSAGEITAEANPVTTVKTCAYVEFAIDSGATNGNTVGFKISGTDDITNSQAYSVSASTPAPYEPGTATIDSPSSTIWTGGADTVWTNTSNWTAGVPSDTKSCIILTSSNNPNITSGTAQCENLTITSGSVTIGSGATLEAYGDVNINSTFTINGTFKITDSGGSTSHTLQTNQTLTSLEIDKSQGTVSVTSSSEVTIDSLTMTGSNVLLLIGNTRHLNLTNGMTINSGTTLSINSGGELNIGNGQTLTVAGGKFKISGVNDAFPQSSSNKGKVDVIGGSGTWGFTATSGTVDLRGFHLERMNSSGLNIGGTTNVDNLDGGQLTNLSSSYGSLTPIQLNTTGTLPSTATNIAWVWGDFNSFDPANTNTPSSGTSYTLISSTGCGSQTIDFTGYTGDWFETEDAFDVTTKVSASSCTINMSASASSVSLASFTATPYTGQVDVRWETNTEKDHKGFNVYRSNLAGDSFVQVNSELIRNLNNYASKKGKYQFIDNDVSNDTTYLYYIEDIEIDGKVSLHGPKSATPAAGLGSAPVAGDRNSDSNEDDNLDGGSNSGGTIANPSYRDLGNGVVIRHQTSSSMLLEVELGTVDFDPAGFDSSYDDVTIEGYSLSTVAGSPALPNRVLLIEIDEFIGSANLINSSVTTSTTNSKVIAPAPTYTADGDGNLQTSYVVNSSVYSMDANTTNDFFSVQSSTVKSGTKNFLKVVLSPIKHNPVQETVVQADTITLEIGFDDKGWDIEPDSDLAIGSVANLLRIDFNKSGFYQVSYDDIDTNNLIYPFDEQDTSDFVLYLRGKQVPLKINSGDGLFKSGDSISFFVEHQGHLDDDNNVAFLSSVPLKNETPARFGSLDSDPADLPGVDENVYVQTISLEENNALIDGVPIGDDLDHFVWSALYSHPTATSVNTLGFDVTLPEIDTSYDEEVRIEVEVIGLPGYFGSFTPHDLELYIDDQLVDNIVFDQNGRQTLLFELEPTFFSGSTNVKFKVPGTYAHSDDYDRIAINKVDFHYHSYHPYNDYLYLKTDESDLVHIIREFSDSSISVFDVTDREDIYELTNMNIFTEDAGTTYQVEFYADSQVNDDNNKELVILTDGAELSPIGLSLNNGDQINLKATSNRADFLIVGKKSLVDAAYDLKAYRESQGMDVMIVTIESIYNQFGYGMETSESIKAFVNYALDYWNDKPEYLLLIGDSTNDPKGHNVWGDLDSDLSVNSPGTFPTPIISGAVVDYSTDNYFVSSTTSYLPRIAVGRLPSNNAEEIENYIQKVMDYESGERLPEEEVEFAFISGKEKGQYEEFSEKNTGMINRISQFSTGRDRTIHYNYEDYADDAAFRTGMLSLLEDNPPTFISFMGHGANNKWDEGGAVLQQDAYALTNEKLPIIVSWNCENLLFHDYVTYEISISEKFVFSKEGGAIAYFGSTTQTTPSAQMALADAFYQSIAVDTNSYYKGQRIGDYLVESKNSLGTGDYEKDIAKSFSLIGDPTLRLPKALFGPKPNAPVAAAPVEESGGGCSAIASENYKREWYEGLLEYLFYLFMILMTAKFNRFLIRRKII